MSFPLLFLLMSDVRQEEEVTLNFDLILLKTAQARNVFSWTDTYIKCERTDLFVPFPYKRTDIAFCTKHILKDIYVMIADAIKHIKGF